MEQGATILDNMVQNFLDQGSTSYLLQGKSILLSVSVNNIFFFLKTQPHPFLHILSVSALMLL